MIQLTVNTVSGTCTKLAVHEVAQGAAVRKDVASSLHIPLEALLLLHKGQVVQDGQQYAFANGGRLVLQLSCLLKQCYVVDRLVAMKRPVGETSVQRHAQGSTQGGFAQGSGSTPGAAVRQRGLADRQQNADSDEEADTTLLPPREVLLQRASRIGLLLAAWVVFMCIAHRYDCGPVAFLLTVVVLVYVNLGQRKAGEASAYSVFNNFVRLPGQLTADEIDRQVRTGHM